MAKWYSEEMKQHHLNSKTNKYTVYHIHYTGKTKDWFPNSLRWGYIGISPYATIEQIEQRYMIERNEVFSGARKNERFVIKMINQFYNKGLINFCVVKSGLTRQEALDTEKFLRPKGYTGWSNDRRVWNSVEGGIDF